MVVVEFFPDTADPTFSIQDSLLGDDVGEYGYDLRLMIFGNNGLVSIRRSQMKKIYDRCCICFP